MRKLLLLATLLVILTHLGTTLKAQDTTSLRMAGFSDGGELILFRNDSTNLYYSPISTTASFNAMFHHPSNGNLYCLYDSVATTGRRDIYEIDPFGNTLTFRFSPSATFLAAACVGPNGIIYAVTGNGATPGVIYAIDMLAGTESLFASTDFTFGGNFQSGLNITYYPPTNELWLFGGAADSLIKINLNTQVETRVPAMLNADGGIKGTYFDGNSFWLASDLSYTYTPSLGDTVHESTFQLPDYITDLELLDLVVGGDTLAICGNDSAELTSRFRFDDYHWFLNGNALPTHNRTIYTTTPGTYQLLAQYDPNGGFYMWSETVEVVLSPSAVTAGFGVSTSSPIVGQAVQFSDSSLNANVYAWDFGDGTFSAASNPSHTYTAAGTYQVVLTVQNGFCTDTAQFTITVLLVGMEDALGAATLVCYPNPANSVAQVALNLPAEGNLTLEVLDLMGSRVALLHEGTMGAGPHMLNWQVDLPAGVYTLRLRTDEVQRQVRMVVQH